VQRAEVEVNECNGIYQQLHSMGPYVNPQICGSRASAHRLVILGSEPDGDFVANQIQVALEQRRVTDFPCRFWACSRARPNFRFVCCY